LCEISFDYLMPSRLATNLSHLKKDGSRCPQVLLTTGQFTRLPNRALATQPCQQSCPHSFWFNCS